MNNQKLQYKTSSLNIIEDNDLDPEELERLDGASDVYESLCGGIAPKYSSLNLLCTVASVIDRPAWVACF